MNALIKFVATLGFIGYLPYAPGTFGSLAALLFFILTRPSPPVHIVFFVALFAVGIAASGRTERLLNEKDSSHIVIDEFAGFAASIIFIPPEPQYYIAIFFLFRFFDILKPQPVKWFEKTCSGGAGIMLDDLIAGIYANLLAQLWMHLK